MRGGEEEVRRRAQETRGERSERDKTAASYLPPSKEEGGRQPITEQKGWDHRGTEDIRKRRRNM